MLRNSNCEIKVKMSFQNSGVPAISASEFVTPYKIAVFAFIREYCLLKMGNLAATDTDNFHKDPKYQEDFCVLILHLTQSKDLEMSELMDLLDSGKYKIMPKHRSQFEGQLVHLSMQKISGLMALANSMEVLLLEPSQGKPMVGRSSIIGLFVRKMVLFFDALTFSQVCTLSRQFEKFVAGHVKIAQRASESMELTGTTEKSIVEVDFEGRMTRKQAELLIAQQAALLQNEDDATTPKSLQEQIKILLKANPNIAETHFLSYLNCQRAKEYCGAFDSLCHYFDRIIFDVKPSQAGNEEHSKGKRYSALNLAAFHTQFGHKEEALAALRGAINLSQEISDSVFLQYALSWLAKLNPCDSIMLERSVTKCSELSLGYLASLGIQTLAKRSALQGLDPSFVFSALLKSDMKNCRYSLADLAASNYALKAALWTLYGRNSMSSHTSQLVFFLNTVDPTRSGVKYNGEPLCVALSNVADRLTVQGQYQEAAAILSHAKAVMSSDNVWKKTELRLQFLQNAVRGEWQECEAIVHKWASLSPFDSLLREAELLVVKGDAQEAQAKLDTIQTILETPEHLVKLTEEQVVYGTVYWRLLTASAQAIGGNSTIAIRSLQAALEYCERHHMQYLYAVTMLQLAFIQHELGLHTKSLELVNQCLTRLCILGSPIDRSRALHLKAKCQIALATPNLDRPTVQSALALMDKARKEYERVSASYHIKECWYLEAMMYHALGYAEERNRCSYQFRLLEEQYSMPYTLSSLHIF